MVAPAVETTRCICAVGGGRFKLVVLQCVAASFGGWMKVGLSSTCRWLVRTSCRGYLGYCRMRRVDINAGRSVHLCAFGGTICSPVWGGFNSIIDQP